MATQETARNRAGMANRLFLDHPRSLGMSWAGHGVGAVAIGVRLVGAGLACLVHAVVPGVSPRPPVRRSMACTTTW